MNYTDAIKIVGESTLEHNPDSVESTLMSITGDDRRKDFAEALSIAWRAEAEAPDFKRPSESLVKRVQELTGETVFA